VLETGTLYDTYEKAIKDKATKDTDVIAKQKVQTTKKRILDELTEKNTKSNKVG